MTPERAELVYVSNRGTTDPQWVAAAAEGWTSEPALTLVPSDENGVIRIDATWDWVSPSGEREPAHASRSYAFEITTGRHPKVNDYIWSTTD